MRFLLSLLCELCADYRITSLLPTGPIEFNLHPHSSTSCCLPREISMSNFFSVRFAVSTAGCTAFHLVHLLLRELLCCKIFHRFHSRSFLSV